MHVSSVLCAGVLRSLLSAVLRAGVAPSGPLLRASLARTLLRLLMSAVSRAGVLRSLVNAVSRAGVLRSC